MCSIAFDDVHMYVTLRYPVILFGISCGGNLLRSWVEFVILRGLLLEGAWCLVVLAISCEGVVEGVGVARVESAAS